MNGHGTFKYYVNFNYTTTQEFCDIRKWCWEQWGPSDDLEFIEKIKDPNISWSWLIDKYQNTMYNICYVQQC